MGSVHYSCPCIANRGFGKCGPIGDCYSCPCIVKQWSLRSVCQLLTATALLVLHTGELAREV